MNSKIRTAHQIRRAYVEFFLEREHTEVPSAPLVPKGDPTLLFTSAGMVQFKDFYLQPDNLPYTRAVSVQKCLRAGDLESVGRTLRHHTFFEMLGNFSFGDYFKKEAIAWAWEFVVDVLQIPEKKLYVSIYEDDDEAFELWKSESGLPGAKIYRLGKKDNFWGPVGKTGVCGPCSEIYYDAGEEKGCGSPDCSPGCDCDRYLEFWNLVFPQFFLEENGEYRPLEKPGIDTGAGLERIAMIMQDVQDNFHTDVFAPLVGEIKRMLPERAAADSSNIMDINMIADHVRALVFTVGDGIYPSNEGRGYLLRRILRRALTRLHIFGVDGPFLCRLVGTVVSAMKDGYPELDGMQDEVTRIINAEEESFFRTIRDGKGRFASIVGEVRAAGSKVIDGGKAFTLYDTYGFPLDLTVALAESEGLEVDTEGFEDAMEEQRRRAQDGSSFEDGGAEMVTMIQVTEGESSIFTGYEKTEGSSTVRSYRAVKKSERKDIEWSDPGGDAWELVFANTPFYATSGGQMADRGSVEIRGEAFEVRDVFKRGGDIVHLVEAASGKSGLEGKLGPEVSAGLKVDREWRMATACNHTATHLLHAALRKVVGQHVKQAGSLVDGERLRFDFNHFQAVTPEEKTEIENIVNRWVREALPVRTETMDYREAVNSGAIALFDEKYSDRVRVIRTGDISAELCGGTHLDQTGRIGLFLIVSESSVAAGVRRIEAVTGEAALAMVHESFRRESESGNLLRVNPSEVPARISTLLEENDEIRREMKKLRRGDAGSELDSIISSSANVDGIKIASGRIPVRDAGGLREQADLFRGRVKTGVAVLSTPSKGKMHFVITVTDDLVERGISADGLVKLLGEVAGGGGGGRKHMAQLGTKDMESEERVFEALPEILKKLIEG